mmetsp:Transcript_50811/g.95027  ORF Transcript_50811/g.95027 Transcript_50811/m.95027 type:complete len:135 (-) Transcript_50811:121-525(-)
MLRPLRRARDVIRPAAAQAFASFQQPAAPKGRGVVPAGAVVSAGAIGLVIASVDYYNRQNSPYQKFLRQKDEEWRKKLGELKAHYEQDPEKRDPPFGTELGHFVRVNRNGRLLPTGLPEWKVRELEAIDGWRWE